MTVGRSEEGKMREGDTYKDIWREIDIGLKERER